jgi:hypothetical protein
MTKAEKEGLTHGRGSREKTALPFIFSHLWGTDMSCSFKQTKNYGRGGRYA